MKLLFVAAINCRAYGADQRPAWQVFRTRHPSLMCKLR